MSSAKKNTIVVLGAGSWGTALAVLLARNGYDASLWGNDPAGQVRLEQERENRVYLPGIPFPEKLHVYELLADAAKDSPRILIAVPSHAFRATLKVLKPFLPAQAILA